MKKLVQALPGEIYAIPLFLSDRPVTENFSREKFDTPDKEFAFLRVIEDRGGSGFIVEVFNLTGSFTTDPDEILKAPRLFSPVATSGLGIYKKRWRKVHSQADYDKERDSNFSEIKLVIGPPNDLRLWQNDKETPIDQSTAKKYELWDIWMSDQLEKRIITELAKA